MAAYPTLTLKPREERRLRAGHAWVFSNEVDIGRSPLKNFQPGDLAVVEDSRGAPLGLAYVNPNALICARLLSRNPRTVINTDWFATRLSAALALRTRLFDQPYYRLAHAESDGLPGLVVDRYGNTLVVQLNTAGTELRKAEIIAALQSVVKPQGILLRNDGSSRELEALPKYSESIGVVPEQTEIEEAGLRFQLPLLAGQKTGWFYDQRDNRLRLQRYARGLRVLDLFSYIGSWGLRAASAGADRVLCVDASAAALEQARHNAKLNKLQLETRQGDALEVLKALKAEQAQFDLVVLDPPALIKRRKDYDAGFEHYARLNHLALAVLAADGILVSCSCSHHLPAADLQRLLLRETRKLGRKLQILEQGGAAPDHPLHPAIPETGYLKAFFCRVQT
ncbi:MAG: class I SAM-dependent rRNA methyltransferase [Nevskiales bacterium]